MPEAIDAIHAAGGVAVWAHPFWDLARDDEVCAALERFSAAGLDGVEAFYTTHTAAQTRLLHEQAARLDLLTTGSADFHGPRHSRFSTLPRLLAGGPASRTSARSRRATPPR